MRQNFAPSLARVLQHEGGYVNADAIREAIESALARESAKYAARAVDMSNHRSYDCSAPDCDRPAYASGYCNAHYIRARLGRDLALPIKNRKRGGQTCIDCGTHTGAKGGWHRCAKHFKTYRQRTIKAAAVEALGGKCSHCKQQHPLAVYDFHHRGVKTDSPATLIGNSSVEKIADELSRCALLCANCHRIEHNGAE